MAQRYVFVMEIIVILALVQTSNLAPTFQHLTENVLNIFRSVTSGRTDSKRPGFDYPWRHRIVLDC